MERPQVAKPPYGLIQSQEILRDIFLSPGRLGHIEENEGDFAKACQWFEKGPQVSRNPAGSSGAAKQKFSLSLNRLGNIEKPQGNLPAARPIFKVIPQIAQAPRGQIGTLERLRNVVVSFYKILTLTRGDEPKFFLCGIK